MVFGPFPNKTVAFNLKLDVLTNLDYVQLASWDVETDSIQFIDLDRVSNAISFAHFTGNSATWLVYAGKGHEPRHPSRGRAHRGVLRTPGAINYQHYSGLMS
jgi:hypothetical protein